MMAYLLRRASILLVTLVLVSALAFLIPYAGQGDPARIIIHARSAESAIDESTLVALRHQIGLDQPMLVQYGRWVAGVLHGDLGYSFTDRSPVAVTLLHALGVSLLIAMTALLAALLLSVPLGTVAALQQGRALDSAITLVTQCFVALPEYWLAPMGILIFALHLGWLPSAGWNSPASLVLPALVLTLRPLAYFTTVTRAAMIEVLDAPYILAARSRGLGLATTILRHGLRNGIIPVVTLFAMWLAGLIGGSVVVEVIFGIPGMGRLIYEAVVNKDMPVLQGGFICIVGLAIVINMLADLSFALLNPAIREHR